jgi:hypothetical protein
MQRARRRGEKRIDRIRIAAGSTLRAPLPLTAP